MPNRERNRSDVDSGERGRTSSGRSSYPDESQNREYYGQERDQSYRPDSERDWNDRDDWNSSERGRSFGDEENYGGEIGRDMFASTSGAPYGSQSDQRPLGNYGRNEYGGQRSSGRDEEHGGSQSRNREGGRRFLSSTDLSSNYQGHYGQPRFGSVGNSSGFGTGRTSMRSGTTPNAGQTTSDRNFYDSSSEGGSSMTRPSYRGLGPKGFQRSDERIREMVSETLEDHHDIDASDIEVHVESGEVTLTGHVSDRSTKRLAEDVIEYLPGVRDVTNIIKVKRGMLGRVADSIQHALGGDEDEETSRSTSSRSKSAGQGKSRNRR